MSGLWVVMPVYHEAEAVTGVVEEWLSVLTQHVCEFTLCCIDDGSTDGTGQILDTLAVRYPEVNVIHQENRGHGQACIVGYRWALSQGAQRVFQIDSDGQCDPAFFARFWENKTTQKPLYGYRKIRQDGFMRFMISRGVSVVCFLATGVWVPDANVPYRLMHRDHLVSVLDRIPPDFCLANILLSVLHQRRYGICFIPIVFRQRAGGAGVVNGFGFLKAGIKLYCQLRRANHTRT